MSAPPPTLPHQQSADDTVLTAAEVSIDLRCSKAQAYHLIKGTIRGVSPLPSISLGRRKLVRRSALEEWKRANERTPTGAMIDPSQRKTPGDA